MKNSQLISFLLCILIDSTISWGQITPPCSLDYGTSTDRNNIQTAMLTGTEQDVVQAINQGKNSRGTMVGCPQADYGPFVSSNISEPNLIDIEQVWNTIYVPYLNNYTIACPELGRSTPALGLGAYYAILGGYYNNTIALQNIGTSLLNTQYNTENASSPLVATSGMYAYYNASSTSDPCAFSGVVGSFTSQLCQTYPSLCVTYTNGLYSGSAFAVADHTYSSGQLVGVPGGGGYDQGWAGVFMLEGALQQTDSLVKAHFLNSAIEAGEWAMVQPLVNNHNYTSKLVWLLAQLYALTGRLDFKTAFLDRLDRNVIPGVLMDTNVDGMVDGMFPSVAFASLSNVAQQPGRNWDGHNALPWYHSMNTWAVLEAYVALRDRGDLILAHKYRPYLIAMLNNLSHELVNLGTPSQIGPGTRDLPYSILLAIWKIAQYENDSHPLWENAAWAIWNTGVFQSLGEHGLNVPLYLLIKQQYPYTPLVQRQLMSNLKHSKKEAITTIKVYPNPSKDLFYLSIDGIGAHELLTISVFNVFGQLVWEKETMADTSIPCTLKGQPSGTYMIKVQYEQNVFTAKLQKRTK